MTPAMPATTERIAARVPGSGAPVAAMTTSTSTRPVPSTRHNTTGTGTRLACRPPRKSAMPQQLEAARASRTATMRGHPATALRAPPRGGGVAAGPGGQCTRSACRGRTSPGGLLQRGEVQVPARGVLVDHAADVGRLDRGDLVPQEDDAGRLRGDHVVDLGPRLAAVGAGGDQRGLRHRVVDGGHVELRP